MKRMTVMPANSSGWFWHCLSRETGRIGHLYSPGAQRGPWEWFPYALDNGAFSAWDQSENTWDETKWDEQAWRNLLVWTQCVRTSGKNAQRPLWAIVPDVPGDSARTLDRWPKYSAIVQEFEIPLALAVQDGMTVEIVLSMSPAPEVICVGGSTEWKWATVEMWTREFPRVHLLRCSSPEKLHYLEKLGVESCDGTGWNRGDRKQTEGIEKWARGLTCRTSMPLWTHVCREPKNKEQTSFA